jgi:hypothetical protein
VRAAARCRCAECRTRVLRISAEYNTCVPQRGADAQSAEHVCYGHPQRTTRACRSAVQMRSESAEHVSENSAHVPISASVSISSSTRRVIETRSNFSILPSLYESSCCADLLFQCIYSQFLQSCNMRVKLSL